MDAMDVLGALLGKKSRSNSPGGNILKDVLGGGRPETKTPSKPTSSRRMPSRTSSSRRPASIDDAARSLEELLNVSSSRYEQRHPQANHPQPGYGRSEQSRSGARGSEYSPPEPVEESSLNEQSVVLIRAMIGAAKADGQINEKEQQEIVGQLGHLSQSEIDFLRAEFARQVDVRELAWSVPLGMEEQAYTLSLIAIDLDEKKEAEYLADLAHGLRLRPARCNEIHQKYGAPVIFRS